MHNDREKLVEHLKVRLKLKYAANCKCGSCQCVPIADLHAAITALAPVEAVPAAWQWRVRAVYSNGITGEWSDWNDGRRPTQRTAQYETEERPLYAHPPAQAGAVTEALREALIFYENHGAGCRLVHSGGDASRNALAKDGGKRAKDALTALTAALGAQTHPEGAVTEAQGWHPIETAPVNQAILVHVPNADYYGNHGVYAAMLVDMGTGKRWMTFGWAIGRDLGVENTPDGWQPLPTPPVNQSEGAE